VIEGATSERLSQEAGLVSVGTESVPASRSLHVALVHDWLTGMRGGEKVLEVLCQLYPHAELFTLVHVPGSVSPAIEGRRIHPSIVQRLPLARRHYRQYLPLFPFAIEQFNLDRYDLVISSSHCAAKAVVRAGRALHICYCHTPMRYAWDQFEAYFAVGQVGRSRGALLRPALAALARWDRATEGRVDRFIANSRHVASRIGQYYNRRATVVYPPVDTAFYQPGASRPEGYALIVSALVPYKRIDLAVESCRRVGMPLRIIGQGPERARLQRIAGPSAQFLGTLTNEQIRALYQRASVVMLPGEEDFGIVPLEAQACGRPVVALARGGALETVVDGVTGVLVREATPEAMADGLERAMVTPFEPATIRRHAEGFGRARFAREILERIEETVATPRDGRRW